MLTGVVIGQCLPRHRNGEFLKFLRTIDHQVPKGLQIHMILDNYGTHTHDNVVAWLDKHPRFHLHFGARPDRCDRGIPPSQQQRSQAVRMDRHGRGDPRESQPRPGRTRINPG